MSQPPEAEKTAPKHAVIPGELSLENLRDVMGGISALAATNGGPKPKPPPPQIINGRYNSPLKSRFATL
ncbi:MAG: hypothetical protein HY291_17005 [Planctomycetes bacterium]|nr:hypothetical protein [Planctomycetota bacterium]